MSLGGCSGDACIAIGVCFLLFFFFRALRWLALLGASLKNDTPDLPAFVENAVYVLVLL
jgi:hypothetical protein